MKSIQDILEKIDVPQYANDLVCPHSKAGFAEGFYSVSSYTPTLVSSTPLNTGMSVGGVGNGFHTTPIGTTPAMSLIPGYLIAEKGNDRNDILDFYISVNKNCDNLKLVVKNFAWFMWFQKNYPLEKNEGELWINDDNSEEDINRILNEIINDDNFLNKNKEKINRWKSELSEKTLQLIEKKEKPSTINYNILKDLFCSSIGRQNYSMISLIGDIAKNEKSGIKTYPIKSMHYRAIYPFSELLYKKDEEVVNVKRYQYSPFVNSEGIVNDIPVNWNIFRLENKTDKKIEVTILQFQENFCGFGIKKIFNGAQDAACSMVRNPNKQNTEDVLYDINNKVFKGLRLFQDDDTSDTFGGDIIVGVMLNKSDESVKFSSCNGLFPEQKKDIIKGCLNSGQVKKFDIRKIQYTGREQLDGIVCVDVMLNPGEIKEIPFLQILNFPKISIKNWQSLKKYSSLLNGKICDSKRLVKKVCENLEKDVDLNSLFIKSSIEKYKKQFPMFSDGVIKKICLLKHNQLSFLSSASTLSVDNKFFIKECAEYPFYNSLDVYFYGSFMLFPHNIELDTLVQKEFAKATLHSDNTVRKYYWDAFRQGGDIVNKENVGVRAQKGAVVHDLGCTFDTDPDGYFWRNAQEWKDLAPKFILMVLRNFHYSKNIEILRECWEAITQSIEFIVKGMPEGEVLPYVKNGSGDTFDEIESNGITIYCSSLWVAGLKATEEIARILGLNECQKKYASMWKIAESRMKQYLWDDEEGIYFFYSTPIINNDVKNRKKLKEKLLRDYKIKDKNKSVIEILNEIIYTDKHILFNKQLKDDVNAYCKDMIQLDKEIGIEIGKNTRLHRLYYKKLFIIGKYKDDFKKDSINNILKDSDDVFADQLLADLYLEILNIKGINSKEKKIKILNGIMKRSVKVKNEYVGISNVTKRDGSPNKEPQAEEIWIGVQYSIASSLLSVGQYDEFCKVIEALYDVLYKRLRMPFAVPEGVIVKGYISIRDMMKILECDEKKAQNILDHLKQEDIISDENRLQRYVTEMDVNLLNNKFVEITDKFRGELLEYFKSKEINYTVGQYLRPGMVFAIDAVIENILNKRID